jgi:hypothetical protein
MPACRKDLLPAGIGFEGGGAEGFEPVEELLTAGGHRPDGRGCRGQVVEELQERIGGLETSLGNVAGGSAVQGAFLARSRPSPAGMQPPAAGAVFDKALKKSGTLCTLLEEPL